MAEKYYYFYYWMKNKGEEWKRDGWSGVKRKALANEKKAIVYAKTLLEDYAEKVKEAIRTQEGVHSNVEAVQIVIKEVREVEIKTIFQNLLG